MKAVQSSMQIILTAAIGLCLAFLLVIGLPWVYFAGFLVVTGFLLIFFINPLLFLGILLFFREIGRAHV